MVIRIVKDTNRTEQFKRALGGEREVAFGIFEDAGAHPNSDLTIAQVGSIHEFGLPPRIPQRSFIRGYIEQNQSQLSRDIDAAVGRVIDTASAPVPRNSADKELKELGKDITDGIKARIDRRIPPPNAPATVAAKGSDIPLIDSGTMRDAIHV